VALLDDSHLHRFNSDQFLSLPGLPERVELIDGVIYDMSPESPLHASTQGDVYYALRQALPGLHVVTGGSLRLTEGFVPIPDVAVYTTQPPEDADAYSVEDLLLAVEIGVATASVDLTVKAPRYAAAGVAELWLLAPARKRLVVCWQPVVATRTYTKTREWAWPTDLERLAGGWQEGTHLL
jgi:Uma2 family endonuclease